MSFATRAVPPPPRIQTALAQYLNEFRAWLVRAGASYQRENPGAGLLATSWWRDVAKNTLEGGSATSQHLLGLAIDVVPTKPGADAAELAHLAGEVVRHFNGAGPGMTAVNEWNTRRPHVHIQKSPRGVWDSVVREAIRLGVL